MSLPVLARDTRHPTLILRTGRRHHVANHAIDPPDALGTGGTDGVFQTIGGEDGINLPLLLCPPHRVGEGGEGLQTARQGGDGHTLRTDEALGNEHGLVLSFDGGGLVPVDVSVAHVPLVSHLPNLVKLLQNRPDELQGQDENNCSDATSGGDDVFLIH